MAFNGSLLSRPSDAEHVDLDLAAAHVLRRLRADSRSVHLAERRRRRREAASALVQGRSPLERDRDARRSGRRDRLHRDGRPRARHLSRRLPAGTARSDCAARAARGGPLAARRVGHRRPRPDLDHEPVVHRQLDARVREALPPLARRPRPRQAGDPGGCHAHAPGTGARHRRDRLRRARRFDRAAEPPGGALHRALEGNDPWRPLLRLRRSLQDPVPRDERARRRWSSRLRPSA